jgi:hypothetical protein
LPQFRHYLPAKSCETAFRAKSRYLPEKGFQPMRKITLAAAIATSALGLAACSGTAENEPGEAVAAMAADAEAADDAAEDGGEAAAATGDESAEAAAEKAADAAQAAADKAAEAGEAKKAAE